MGGNHSVVLSALQFALHTGFSFSLFEPSGFTQADVRSENRQLQSRLKSVVSLERMKEALEKKDMDLAAAQKEPREKTKLADQKLASVGKLEEENAKLKTAISEANREVEQLKKDKENLTTEVGGLKTKTDKLESYLEQPTAKLVLKLEGMINRLITLLPIELCCHAIDSSLFGMGQNCVRTLRLILGGWTRVSTPSTLW